MVMSMSSALARWFIRQQRMASVPPMRVVEGARTGIAILMVEQNAKQALNIADKGYVLVQGENRYTDTGAKLLADPEVRRAFLGG